MSAISLPIRRWVSVPAYFAIFSASESWSRNRSSRGSKSISLTKLRLRRLKDNVGSSGCRSVGRVALDRAGHAVASAASASQLEACDRKHLDAGRGKRLVRPDVALISDDDAGLERDDVVAVVPLLALL